MKKSGRGKSKNVMRKKDTGQTGTVLPRHPVRPTVVDAVVIEDNGILLVKRKTEPFKGAWALPGGFVDVGEDVETAAVREVKEETGLTVKLTQLIGVYSKHRKDPRHSVSVSYLAKPIGGKRRAQRSEISEVKWFQFDRLPKKLAFDHAEIVKDALNGFQCSCSF